MSRETTGISFYLLSWLIASPRWRLGALLRVFCHGQRTQTCARYSTLSELTVRGLHNVAETYGDNAKVNNIPVSHRSAVDLWMLLEHISFRRSHSVNGHFAWSNAVGMVRIQE
jgi:hypothetical protein